MGKLLLLGALIVAGVVYAAGFATAGGPRAGLWTGTVELADFEVEGLPSEHHDRIRDELLEVMDLKETLGRPDSVCLSAADLRQLTSLADRPRPAGWSADECAFTRNGNTATAIDVAGRCAKKDGTVELNFTVAGTAKREAMNMELDVDHHFVGDGMTADARMKLRIDAQYSGPCRKDESALSEILGS